MKKIAAALGALSLSVAGMFTAATASAVDAPPGSSPSNPIVLDSPDLAPKDAVTDGPYANQCATEQTWTLTGTYDVFRYSREVPAVQEESHPEYRWKVYNRTYDQGQQETFSWGVEERTRVQTDNSHQQYTYVKQVQTRDWVKDYATEYRYQKQTQTSMRHGDGAWQVVSDWSWWEPASIKPWTSQDVEVLESGDHAEWREWHSTGFLRGHWDYYDRDYRYVKNGQTRQVEVGGHWGPWSAWSNYGPVAPVVTTTPQSSINGWAIDSVHFVGSSQSAQYRWTLGSQVTITDPPTFGDWTAWTLTSSNLPSAPVLPANTATHEYRVVGPTGNGDAIAPSFTEWAFAGYTDWQTSPEAPADPDGEAGVDNPLNLVQLGSRLSRVVVTTEARPAYTEYFVLGGEPSRDEDDATWVTEDQAPGEGWEKFASDVRDGETTYYFWTDGVECALDITETLACGTFDVTVDHNTPWRYGVTVEVDGEVVDTLLVEGAGSDTLNLTFEEDEFGGSVDVRYYVTDATEWDIVPADLNRQAIWPEIGDAFRAFTVDTNCVADPEDPKDPEDPADPATPVTAIPSFTG